MARDVRLTVLLVALVAALVEPYMPTKSVRELEMSAPKASCGLNVGICKSDVCATVAARYGKVVAFMAKSPNDSAASSPASVRLVKRMRSRCLCYGEGSGGVD